MDNVYKELDEVKTEMEKLKEDYRIKLEISESLRKAHNKQLIKLQEAKSEIEKQAQELNAKADEISLAKQMYEELKSCLSEKESVLLHLRSAHDNLQADSAEKLHKLEGENRELSSSLDEANMRNKDQEEKFLAFKEEIEHLKELLSVSAKKNHEAKQRSQVSKELSQRDDQLQDLEENNRKFEEQLKWKKEQFQHLEEAHGKLKDQYGASKREWAQEKSMLLDEICTLQTSLDSQTRISQDLQYRLQACNQALAHEESRRKLLEVQLSESKTCYENVSMEYQEAKSKIESLAIRRDEEIAALRNALGKKATLLKEMEFRKCHLEQENQELRRSLKELQEDQINNAGAASSMTKLRNKLKGLEQVHKECSRNLIAMESKLNSQMDKMTKELDDLRAELNSKNTQTQELLMELEGCYSSMSQLMLHNEEISVMLILLQSGLSQACTELSNLKVVVMKLPNKDRMKQIAHLTEQLEQKNNALVEAHARIEQEREKAASSVMRFESLDLVKQQNLVMQSELHRSKEMLEESSGCQLCLKEEALQMQNALKEDLRKVSEALDKVNSELAEKIHEGSEIEFELERWISVAERLKGCLDENQEIRREMEASLLAQAEAEQELKQDKESLLYIMEEKNKKIDALGQQIVRFKQQFLVKEAETSRLARMETEKAFKLEKENFHPVAEGKEKGIENLQKEIAWLEQEFMKRELEGYVLAQIEAEKTFEEEKNRRLHVTEEKDKSIENLQQLIMSMKRDFERSVEVSVLSGLAEKQAEVDLLREAWEKITTAYLLAEVEIQEKNFLIVELEGQISNLQQKLESQEKYISTSKQIIEQLEAALQEKHSEAETLMDQLVKLKTSKGLIEELESEKGLFLSDIVKLSSEKEELKAFINVLWNRISELSSQDAELIGRLGMTVQSFDQENAVGMDLSPYDEIYDPSQENFDAPLVPTEKRVEVSTDGRSPLKELNKLNS